MASISKRGRRSRAQWRALIARAAHSELSVAEFCRRESVSTASFYTWRNRLRGETDSVSPPTPVGAEFIDLGILGDPGSNASPWLIELDLGAGMVLRLRRG